MNRDSYSGEYKSPRFKRYIDWKEVAEIISRHEMWLVDSSKGIKANFQDCLLKGFRFEQATDLRGANLLGADLQYAKLHNVKLCGANLKYANLRNAELNNVDFYRANLQSTQFDYEYLNKANLEGAFGL